MQNTLTFDVQNFEADAVSITPCIDGVRLSNLVAEYEIENSFVPSGGYGGIIPEYFNYGPLDQYFLGHNEHWEFWTEIGGIYVLGCDCGEVGCWPLECGISISAKEITWRNFRQPHRSERDYSKFGPYVFDRAQYEEELRFLLATMR